MSEPAPETPPPPTPAPLTPDQTSGRLFVRWNVGALLLAAVAFVGGAVLVRGAPPAREAWDPAGLLADPRWDDGLAEVARYAARRTVYGEERAHEVVRLAVKEPHDPVTGVKPDGPSARAVDALKTLSIHVVPTGRPYEYRQTVAVFLDRRDPRRVLAATMASTEWCGVTTVRLRRSASGGGGGLERDACSYFDGEGTWQDRLGGEVWLEDQLPFTLRAVDWAAQDALEVDLLPSLLASHAPRGVRPVRTRIARAGFEQVTTPLSTFDCVRLEATIGDRAARWWLATTGEHRATRPLVRWEDATGAGELTRLERLAYWR